ncbi:MAG: tol-pal system protein YbgF [Candidatus Cloacimonadia bacterium]
MGKVAKLLLILVTALGFTQCAQMGGYQTPVAGPADMAEVQTEMDSIKSQLDKMNTEYDQRISEVEDKLVAVDILQSKITRLENQIDILNSQLSEHQAVIESWQEQGKTPSSKDEYVFAEDDTAESIYSKARQMYLEGEFKAALNAFSEFLNRFPNHSLAPNAQYWLAECYYSLEEYETAIYQFDKVIINYPGSEKFLDAKLKIAYCLEDMGEYEGALAQLREIAKQYPEYERISLVNKKIHELEDKLYR